MRPPRLPVSLSRAAAASWVVVLLLQACVGSSPPRVRAAREGLAAEGPAASADTALTEADAPAATRPLTVMSWNVLFEYQRIPALLSLTPGTSVGSDACDPQRAPFSCTFDDPVVCRRCDGTELQYRYSEFVREELAYLISRPELRWENRRQLISRVVRDVRPDLLALQEVQGDAQFGPDMFGFFRSEFGDDYEIVTPETNVANLRLLANSAWPGPACNRDQCRACNHGVGCVTYDVREDRKSSQNWVLFRRTVFELVDSGAFEIPTDDNNGRAVVRRLVTWARLRHRGSGRVMVTMSAHAHPKFEELRTAEMRLVDEFVSSLDVPVVLMGDFNAPPTSASCEIIRSHLVDTFRAHVGEDDPRVVTTSTALALGVATDVVRPDWRIDYIWASPELAVVDAEVLTPRFDDVLVDVIHDGEYRCGAGERVACALRSGVYPSDHFPAVARVRLSP